MKLTHKFPVSSYILILFLFIYFYWINLYLSVKLVILLDFVYPKNLKCKYVGISNIFHFKPNIENFPSKSGLNFKNILIVYKA